MLETDSTTAAVASGPAGRPARRRSPGPVDLAPALALGFSSIIVQTLVLRELMVAWSGDETSFGIGLAVWLLAAGSGSALGGRLAGRLAEARTALAAVLGGLALVAPVSILVARAGRSLLGGSAGELAALGQLLAAPVLAAGPFALLAGAGFALAVRALARSGTGDRRDAARVYAVEALGAVIGGALLSFVLLPRVGPLTATGVCSAALALAAVRAVVRGLNGSGRPKPRARASCRALVVLAFLAALALLAPTGRTLDRASIAAQWSGLGFVLSRDSVHGRVVAARRGSQLTVYETGVLAASAPDRLAAEEAVHFPMLQHAAPSRVLLIGGGLGGAVAEVLRHPDVTAVDYVELDPVLLRAAREAFSDSMLEGMADPRVDVLYGDARRFVRTTDREYDVIVVNVPDPVTTQLNRFYTVEFFDEARRLLRAGGVIGLTCSGSANYIPPELAELLLCLTRTLEQVFPKVELLPGDPCHLVAGDADAVLRRSGSELADEVERRGLDTRFVARSYLLDRLSDERLATADAALARAPVPPPNRDLDPRGYLASLVVRSRLRSGTTAFYEAGRRAARLPLVAAIAAAVVLLFGVAPRLAAGRAPDAPGAATSRDVAFSRAVVLSVVVVGFTEMSLEISALVAYQSLYGYVYGRLAVITASFMAGLALGGWAGTRLATRSGIRRGYLLLQCGITAVPVVFGLAVGRLGFAASSGAGAGLFPALVAGSAVMAGVQFPLAAAILAALPRAAVARQAGALYAADLLGAALGALGASLLLLPVLGTSGTMTALALINAAVLLTLSLASGTRARTLGAAV